MSAIFLAPRERGQKVFGLSTAGRISKPDRQPFLIEISMGLSDVPDALVRT